MINIPTVHRHAPCQYWKEIVGIYNFKYNDRKSLKQQLKKPIVKALKFQNGLDRTQKLVMKTDYSPVF